MKTAIVLLNLGGPLKRADVRPFLFNFFMDKNIVSLPFALRFPLAAWVAWSRARTLADKAYRELDYKSPLLENTQAQAKALQEELSRRTMGESKVFVSMRYWHPRAQETANELRAYAPARVVLLPLYPQFSKTTAGSSFQDIRRAAKDVFATAQVHNVKSYPTARGYVSASADNIRAALETARAAYGGKIRVLFSAHGLPEKIIKAGDPYQAECEQSARAIVQALGIEGLDWAICYQSRVGRLKWIGPSTLEEIERAAADNTGLVVYPHAFVSEHVETLVEIDIEYRKRAKALGIPYFGKAETVGTHPDFIAALADMAQTALHDMKG